MLRWVAVLTSAAVTTPPDALAQAQGNGVVEGRRASSWALAGARAAAERKAAEPLAVAAAKPAVLVADAQPGSLGMMDVVEDGAMEAVKNLGQADCAATGLLAGSACMAAAEADLACTGRGR